MKREWDIAFKTHIALMMMTSILPIALFIFFGSTVFSEIRIGGIWLSSLAADCFALLCIPAYAAALYLVRKCSIARSMYPKWQVAIFTMIAVATPVVLINVYVVISGISYMIESM